MIKIKLAGFADEAGNSIDEQISALKEQGKKKQRFCVVFSDFNALC